MNKKDILTGAFIGAVTGALWAWVFYRLDTFGGLFEQFNLPDSAVWSLIIITAVVFVFGLYLGLWLSRWKHFFISFSRFVAVGFMNAGIDFAVFNFLLFFSGILTGLYVSLFKGISFVFAFTNSYFWSKYWVFESGKTEKTRSEFIKFSIVTVIGLFVNVGVTSFVVFFVNPQFGLGQLAWDNIGAVFGSLAGLAWNFIGYKLIVFKKEATILSEEVVSSK